MSRILWLSNAPWAPSGYGEQSALFGPRVAALGHEVAFVANHGVRGKVDEWNGFRVYPDDGDWGNRALGTYLDDFNGDATIALCDSFVLIPDAWYPKDDDDETQFPDDFRFACWAPIDHVPIPPPALAVLAHDKVQPIAMSRFGEKLMREFELDPLYVPHGVDTRMFRPMGGDARDKARDALDIPRDAFLVGMVSANKSAQGIHRKAYPQAFQAFAQFAKQHDDAILYAHTRPSEIEGGQDLDVVATICGVPNGKVRFPKDEVWHLGVPPGIMAALYQAFDVLLMPSMGEGFGIPLIEAQACGVPVIASNHTAMTELCQAGWLVQGDLFLNYPARAFFIVPFVDSIVSALEAAYDARGDEKLRAGAVEFAHEYDANRVALDYWQPALAQFLGGESRQVRRARERAQAKRKERRDRVRA